MTLQNRMSPAWKEHIDIPIYAASVATAATNQQLRCRESLGVTFPMM